MFFSFGKNIRVLFRLLLMPLRQGKSWGSNPFLLYQKHNKSKEKFVVVDLDDKLGLVVSASFPASSPSDPRGFNLTA